MAQNIPVGKNGADSRRVLEALTPPIGSGAPATHATYLGQIYIDTAAVPRAAYISIAIDSATAANDWQKVTFAV
jgi:hypothetical protein